MVLRIGFITLLCVAFLITLGALPANMNNWAVEEARIRGGYNNTYVGQGVKAFLVEDSPNASFRINSLIYSGIFNSRTGINDTNVFSVGEDIIKSLEKGCSTLPNECGSLHHVSHHLKYDIYLCNTEVVKSYSNTAKMWFPLFFLCLISNSRVDGNQIGRTFIFNKTEVKCNLRNDIFN